MIRFLLGNIRWLGAAFLLAFFSSFGQTFFISLSNDAIRTRFDLSHGSFGLIYALATLASAATLLEFGKIVDKVSVRTSAVIVLLGAAGATLLLSVSSAIWMLFIAVYGLRLFGQGMMSQVAMTATGRWFDAQRGRAVSLVSLGYPLGEAIFPVVAVLVITSAGFSALWSGGAVVIILFALPLVYWLLSRERTPQEMSEGEEGVAERRHWRRTDVIQHPDFYLLLMGVLCPGFMVTCFFFHQLHLMDLKDWPITMFASGFSVFAVAQLLTSLVMGVAIDKFGSYRMLPVYLLPMAVGLVLVGLLNGVWVIFPILFLIGMTAGGGATIMGALWPELFGLRYLGEIRALTFAAMVASTAISPFLTGLLIDQGISFITQLQVMGWYAIFASVLMWQLQGRLHRHATGV